MTLALLQRIALFRCLNPAEARALAQVCRVQVCARGETIFSEGTRATEVSFVALGAVKVVKATPSRSVIVRIVSGGGPVGLVAAWEGKPYSGTAIAVEPSSIVHVPEREFFAVTDRHPEMVRQLLHLMMARQADLAQRVSEMTGPVESRVAQALLDLAATAGKTTGNAAVVRLALTRQEIADLAGTTMETAIRIMSRWGKEGLVLTEDDGFTIPDVARLRSHLA